MADGGALKVPTFVKVDGSQRTLGDMVPKSAKLALAKFTASNFFLTMYNVGGGQRKVKDDAKILALYPEIAETALNNATVSFFYYYKATELDKEGWYLTADGSHTYKMNAYPLYDGDGFFMYATSAHDNATTGEKGVTLTYSGAVATIDMPVTVADGGALTGNMVPAATTLGALTPVSAKLALAKFTASNFFLTMYNVGGGQRKVKDDAKILALYPEIAETALNTATVSVFYYYKATELDKAGWYLTADGSHTYCLNNYPLEPGDGFFMYATSAHDNTTTGEKGVTLTFKSPLAQEK